MNNNIWDRILTIPAIYKELPRLKGAQLLKILIKPADSIRYLEFSYFIKYLKSNRIKFNNILDVSSPYMMAYMLSRTAKVIKTDINYEESKAIHETKNLIFKLEDGTNLSFENDTFDLVYSISVVEHIYEKYIEAILEMERVCKPGGIIYLTFPVSKTFKETWLESDIYSHQAHKKSKTFFQYQFDEASVNKIISSLRCSEVIQKDIFWERVSGSYDKLMNRITINNRFGYFGFILNAITNFVNGLWLLKTKSEGFDQAVDFGNISILIRKK